MKTYPVITFTRAANSCNENREFLSLASSPCDEQCMQAGSSYDLQILECTTYINQLIRFYGPVPEGNTFFIIENFHEFGTYYEAGIFYVPTLDEDETESISEVYAMQCEQGPETWDLISIRELEENKHPLFYTKIIQLQRTA